MIPQPRDPDITYMDTCVVIVLYLLLGYTLMDTQVMIMPYFL